MAKIDNLQLMGEAERIATAMYPDALLVAADGQPSSGLATSADSFNEWLFLFQLQSANESVSVHWLDNVFDPPQHHPHPITGVMHEPLPRTMSLDVAIGLLRRAGYTNAFKSVSFFKSESPSATEAAYIFTPLYLLVKSVSGIVLEGV